MFNAMWTVIHAFGIPIIAVVLAMVAGKIALLWSGQ